MILFQVSILRITLYVLIALSLTSCINYPIVESQNPDGGASTHTVTQGFWFRGGLQGKSVNVAEVCGSPDNFVSVQRKNPITSQALVAAQFYLLLPVVISISLGLWAGAIDATEGDDQLLVILFGLPVVIGAVASVGVYAIPYTPRSLEITCNS